MNPTTICPNRNELAAFLSGGMSELRLQEVGDHLAGCAACMEALDRCDAEDTAQNPDTVLSMGSEQPGAPPVCNEPECARMIAAAKEIHVAQGKNSEGAVQRPRALPATLGQYELLERIGEGGMGAVYKSRHKRLDRVVSLKVIVEHRATDQQSLDRFVREWVALARLDHEHIVRAIDADEDAGFHFLVMEYVEGLDLARLVRRGGRLSVPDACEIIRQAALGLQYIDDHKLVHRDLKPSNLIIAAKGRVKILDLGLALWKNDDSAVSGLTVDHQVLGTVDYISPEQAFDSHAVDIRADIYSLGCTLYFLLCGQAPFSGSDYPNTLKKLLAHSQAAVPSVVPRREDVPPRLDAFLRRLMAKSPDDRPAAPGKVALELAQFAAGSDLQRLVLGASTLNRENVVTIPKKLASDGRGNWWRRWSSLPITGISLVLRKSSRTRIALGSLLLAALVASGFLAKRLFLTSASADPVRDSSFTATPLNTDAESDGEWHSVLFKRPTPLLFQPSNGASWWSYDQDSGQVRIDSVGEAVLQFGEVTADNYEVVAKIHQAPWSGGIGLFFGCHPTKFSDWRFQTLYVGATDGSVPGGKKAFHVTRNLEFIVSQEGAHPACLGQSSIPESVLGMASGSTLFQSHCLRFVVRNSRLAEVWFDAESFPDLIREPVWPGQPPRQEDLSISTADGAGGFGLFCNRGSGNVMEARYRILKGATAHGS